MKLFYKQLFKTVCIVFVLIASSCKSSKAIIASGKASNKLSAKQVIKQHQTNHLDFNTLQAKVRIDLTQKQKTQGITFTLRVKKDETIWLSAPLGLARLMITPEKVRFYNKQDNEYFDGDYKLLSNVVGVDLDFAKVQNILLGDAIFNLENAPHSVKVNDNNYQLKPKKQNPLLELFYLVDPSHFKMNSQQLYQPLKKRMLQVDYASYQKEDDKILPKDVKVIAVDGADEIIVDLKFKSITLNQELRFPFKIPSGYEEIKI